jgi:hypothetical protein
LFELQAKGWPGVEFEEKGAIVRRNEFADSEFTDDNVCVTIQVHCKTLPDLG